MNQRNLGRVQCTWSKAVLACLTLIVTSTAGLHAAELDLSRVPLLVNASVAPNILVTLDDSGSMGFGYMPDAVNGWATTNCNRYDSNHNPIYFNPDAEYLPPLRPNGTPFANANFNSAKYDGFDLYTTNTANLATAYRVSRAHQGGYGDQWITSSFPAGVQGSCGRNCTTQRAFYCRAGTVHLIENESHLTQKFANWFQYYRTRGLVARTALSRAFVPLDPEIRVAAQNLWESPFEPGVSEIRPLGDPTWRNAFFNDWLYRSPFSGITPTRPSLIRAGEMIAQNNTSSDNTNPFWDRERRQQLSCRQNFHVMVTDGYTNETNSDSRPPATIGNTDTSSRPAFPDDMTLNDPAATVFTNHVSGSGNLNPRAPNMADIAMHYWARDLRSDLPNNVPSYYQDQRTGVVPGAGANEVYYNPANDPGDWQRMVNFFVTFGVGGSLGFSKAANCSTNPADSDASICQDTRLLRLRRGLDRWPAVDNNSPSSIDDTWHAAVNSRGDYLSADNPEELVNALSSILDNVSSRRGVTGSAGSSAFQRAGSMMFESSYDSGDWTGDLEAFLLNDDGSKGAPAWDAGSAAQQLDGRGFEDREIITWRPSGSNPRDGTGTRFRWAQLSAEQQALLNVNPVTGVVDGRGEARVDFLRGQRNTEQSVGGVFRNRGSVLGPFLDSNLVHVQAPAHAYSGRPGFPEGGQEYAEFRETHASRAPTLYIGGNGGMLHAFDARTGRERWAFVPNKVIRNLGRLTTPQFNFVPTVNGSPAVADVYFGAGGWKTVLVGTLGLGGQAVFALDVTDPASPEPLWEFTDAHARNLGYTYGQPRITRLRDGRWVAIISGGYNSQSRVDQAIRGLPPLPQPQEDDATVGDGRGALFVLDIATGAIVHEFQLPSGNDGLAQATVGEYGNNFQADFAVAGDLNGNLWRFGLGEDDWGEIKHVFVGSSTRPITSAPRVFPDPSTGKALFVFGTGKYLEDDDRNVSTSSPRQAVYGIRECRTADCPSDALDEDDLVEQQFTAAADGYIQMSDSGIPYVPSEEHGWFVRLGNPSFLSGALIGERVVDLPLAVFSAGIVVIETYMPSAEACSPLGSRALYVLSAYSGGYALPGGMSEDGTTILPGSPVFVGRNGSTVGHLDDTGQKPQMFIREDGTLGGPGIPAMNFGVTPRRRGWREILID